MFRIETERLIIRPWRAEDRAAFHAIMTDPVVMKHLHGGKPYTDQQTDEWLARQARQLAEFDLCMGALEEKASARIVGIAGTQPLGTTGDLELGWILGRESWGRGYAVEAGGAAMHYVLHTLDRPRVKAIIDPDNEASKKVAARLGMQYEARYTGAELGHRMPEIVVDVFVKEK